MRSVTEALVLREEINEYLFGSVFSFIHQCFIVYINLDKCNSCTCLIKCFLKKIKMFSVLFFLFIR